MLEFRTGMHKFSQTQSEDFWKTKMQCYPLPPLPIAGTRNEEFTCFLHWTSDGCPKAQTVVSTYLQEPYTLCVSSFLLLLFHFNNLTWMILAKSLESNPRLRNMSQVFKSTDALVEYVGSNPSTHIKSSCIPGSKEPDTPFWLPWVLYTYRWADAYTNM